MITAEEARVNSNNVVEWALKKIDKQVKKASTQGYDSVKWTLDGVFNDNNSERSIKLQDDLINRLESYGYKVVVDKIHYCILDSLIISW